jgi:hypothetical protein
MLGSDATPAALRSRCGGAGSGARGVRWSEASSSAMEGGVAPMADVVAWNGGSF